MALRLDSVFVHEFGNESDMYLNFLYIYLRSNFWGDLCPSASCCCETVLRTLLVLSEKIRGSVH